LWTPWWVGWLLICEEVRMISHSFPVMGNSDARAPLKELGVNKRVTLSDLSLHIVQEHVHLRHSPSIIIQLLTVEKQLLRVLPQSLQRARLDSV
jgi:hypothetical protein